MITKLTVLAGLTGAVLATQAATTLPDRDTSTHTITPASAILDVLYDQTRSDDDRETWIQQAKLGEQKFKHKGIIIDFMVGTEGAVYLFERASPDRAMQIACAFSAEDRRVSDFLDQIGEEVTCEGTVFNIEGDVRQGAVVLMSEPKEGIPLLAWR